MTKSKLKGQSLQSTGGVGLLLCSNCWLHHLNFFQLPVIVVQADTRTVSSINITMIKFLEATGERVCWYFLTLRADVVLSSQAPKRRVGEDWLCALQLCARGGGRVVDNSFNASVFLPVVSFSTSLCQGTPETNTKGGGCASPVPL